MMELTNIKLCVYCRHWMAGSLNPISRCNDMVNGEQYTCHVKQPTKTFGDDSCESFEKAYLNGETPTFFESQED